MRKSIIQRIFDGEFYPAEDITFTERSYHVLSKEISMRIDELERNLADSDRQSFTQLLEMMHDLHMQELYKFYWSGFRDGIFLIAELFGEEGEYRC